MRRRRGGSLPIITILAVGALVWTIVVGNTPQLGLDLQGGVSVVLQPPSGTPSDTVDTAIEVIRNRVDALGVAEPQITRSGSAVVVELPGVKDQKKAIELIGTTAQLRFRPVLAQIAPEGASPPSTTTTTAAPTTTTTAAAGATTTSSTAPTSTTSTTEVETTTREDNKADTQVILPDKEGASRYVLGPAEGTGEDVASARAELINATWQVSLTLTEKGIENFNKLAGVCYTGGATCPPGDRGRGRIAIELDGVVESAPEIQEASFERDQISISGRGIGQSEAKDLALVLKYGSLPVQLEQQTVQTVSATLGKDSLNAGLIAGLIGTVLVLLYMCFYYRVLGLVVVAGLGIWSALNWSIISYLGVNNGLALSLSGVTGLVVSVGVTVDSYVVYFERLKDELRAGRTVRSAIDSAFKHSFRTVLIADTAAFLAAAVLYVLTVGPVRGFAFFLGLATVLDVVVAYFFKRPLVAFLGRRGWLQRSKFVGVELAPEPVRPGLRGSSS
jgi:preprotein translocase subunit SecD